MNSCYGKCIEKPVMKDSVYVKDEIVKKKRETFNPYIRFVNKHYNEIVEDIKVSETIHEMLKTLRLAMLSMKSKD